MFVVSRIESYKFSQCGSVFAEAERVLNRYENPDWDPQKVKDNIYLVEPTFPGRLEDYILSLKKEYKCRLNVNPDLAPEKQTNVMCQTLFSASPEFFENMTSAEIENYFRYCLAFFNATFPSVEILSAVIHNDEKTPHMHISFLPLLTKVNSKGKEKTVFSTSDLFSGKDFFAQYQDKFFEFMNDRYMDFHLERRGEDKQQHLTVKEYKEKKEAVKQAEMELHRVSAAVDLAKEELENTEALIDDAKSSITPDLQVKIENAQLRSRLSLYDRVFAYLKAKFPDLSRLVDAFLHCSDSLTR